MFLIDKIPNVQKIIFEIWAGFEPAAFGLSTNALPLSYLYFTIILTSYKCGLNKKNNHSIIRVVICYAKILEWFISWEISASRCRFWFGCRRQLSFVIVSSSIVSVITVIIITPISVTITDCKFFSNSC